MKILLKYLKPYKWLIAFSLFLATINQVFSLFAPAITGNILDKLVTHPNFFDKEKLLPRNMDQYLYGEGIYHGVFYFLTLLIGTAMISRIAKAFQDNTIEAIIRLTA